MSTPIMCEVQGEHFGYLCRVADPAGLAAFARRAWTAAAAATPGLLRLQVEDGWGTYCVPADFDEAHEMLQYTCEDKEWFPAPEDFGKVEVDTLLGEYVYWSILHVSEYGCWLTAGRKHDDQDKANETPCIYFKDYIEGITK